MNYFGLEDIYGTNREKEATIVRVVERVDSNGFLVKTYSDILITEGVREFSIDNVNIYHSNILEITLKIIDANLFMITKVLKCNLCDIESNLLISEILTSTSQYLNKDEFDLRELIGISGTIDVDIYGKGTAGARNIMSKVKILNHNKMKFLEIRDEIVDGLDLIEEYGDSPRKLEIVNEFIDGYVDKDHYQTKGSTFYRFSAIKKFDTDITKEIFEQQIPSILKMDTLPNQIFISENSMELSFYPHEYFYFKNKNEYLNLMLKFADFVESSGIDGLNVNTGSLGDSAMEVSNNLEVREGIDFNKKEFGSDRIEVWGDISMNIKH